VLLGTTGPLEVEPLAEGRDPVRVTAAEEGTVDVLLPVAVVGGAMLGRDLAVIEEAVRGPVAAGVPLIELPAFCFVGDIAGDLRLLVLPALDGVGLTTRLSLPFGCEPPFFAPSPALLALPLLIGAPLFRGF